MTSRILSELERSICTSRSEQETALLRAERALHLARRGGESETFASQEIQTLRRINSTWGHPVLSAWCHLAEGMLQLTIGNHKRAADSLERARVVSFSVSDRRTQSWAIALQAYLHYVLGHIEESILRVRQVIDWVDDADPLAVARAKMLAGQLLHYAGRFDLARSWYAESRSHAISRGDDGFVSALLFNIASHHLCMLRQEYFRRRDTSAIARMIVLAVESMKNYDELVDIKSQESFSSTLRASIFVFCERFIEAQSLLQSVQGLAEREGLSKLSSICLADLAFCHLKMGDAERAVHAALAAEEAIVEVEHPENAAYTKDRLAQIYEALDLKIRAVALHEGAAKDWKQYETEQTFTLDCLYKWKII